MESILFNRISGLGDILMTTAVVRVVRLMNPDSYISYRTNHPELLEGNSDINEIIKADTGLQGNEIFDRDYTILDLDFCVESKLVDLKGKITEAEYMCETRIDLFFKAVGLETPEYPKMKYVIKPEEEKYARDMIKTLKGHFTVVYNLNSISAIRTYPIDLSIEVIRLLLGQRINVIVIGNNYKIWGKYPGNFNEYYYNHIKEFNKDYFIDMTDKTTIRQMLALVGNSNLVITGDTGVLHATNAIGIPCIGLFGNIEPKLRCYYYDNIITIFKKLNCSSDCGDRGPIMSEKCESMKDILASRLDAIGAKCMRVITPKEIFDTAIDILGLLTIGITNSETSRVRQYVLPYCYGKGADIGAVGGCGEQNKWECGVKSDSIVVDLRPTREPSIVSDARKIPQLEDKSLDYVYSSHMLEDLIDEDIIPTLNEWFRILKDEGYLMIYCPVQHVYKRHCEITNQPYNRDHKVGHFSLRYVKNKLLQSNYKYEIVYEIPIMNNYSFLIILKKKRAR